MQLKNKCFESENGCSDFITDSLSCAKCVMKKPGFFHPTFPNDKKRRAP